VQNTGVVYTGSIVTPTSKLCKVAMLASDRRKLKRSNWLPPLEHSRFVNSKKISKSADYWIRIYSSWRLLCVYHFWNYHPIYTFIILL